MPAPATCAAAAEPSAYAVLSAVVTLLPDPRVVMAHMLTLFGVLAVLVLLALAYLNYVNGSCPLVLHSVSKDMTVVSGRRGERKSVWSLREYLDVACPSFKVPFQPTPFLPLGHLQTYYASLGTLDGCAEYFRDLLDTPDGGQIAIDWSKPVGVPYREDTPTVVLTHGLTGGSHESYVQDMVHYLVSPPRGYRCVVVNFRGCADSELMTPQLYNGAYTEDFHFALKHIRSVIPKAKLAAIGYSLGSNVLVKYLGEQGSKAPFCAAVSVCNPFDFLLSAEEIISTPVKRIYSRALASNLKKAYLRHAHMISQHPSVRHDRVMMSNHVWEFDDRVTRVVFGYHTVEDYYRDASSSSYIDNVRVPLFCLNALDDPISPVRAIPFAAADENPFVVIGTTRMGGHIGHFTGLRPKRWSTAICGEFLSAMLEADSVTLKTQPTEIELMPPASGTVDVHIEREGAKLHQRVANTSNSDGRDSAVADVDMASDNDEPVRSAGIVSAPEPRSIVRATTEPTQPSSISPAIPKSTHAPAAAKPTSRDAVKVGPGAIVRHYGARAWMMPLVRWIIEHATGSRALAILLALLGLRKAFTRS